MTDEEALQQFGGRDDQAEKRAFEHLHRQYLSFTGHVLRQKFSDCNPADIENATQQAFLNLWQSRQNIYVSDLAAWRGLLSTTARRCYIDIMRARKPEIPLGPDIDPSRDDDADDIVEELARAAQIRRLIFAADVCWLGISPEHTLEEHNRRLLAARLYYQERAEKDEILDLLNRPRPGVRPLSMNTLLDWLNDPGTLLRLAFSALYYAPAALTTHLLEMDDDTTPEFLDVLLTELAADDCSAWWNAPWTPPEAHAILWRYYRNVTPGREHSIPQSKLNLEELASIFDRCRALFPFSNQMQELLAGTEREFEALCGPSESGLWRRLAFQYRYLDDLAHQDIEDRIEPAARQVHFPISQTVLQGWLSSQRLLAILAKTCKDLFKENSA